jgi:hypothetical protein
MFIITSITDSLNQGYIDGLKASCNYHNLMLETITFESPWKSHRLKDSLVKQFLLKLNPNEIVLFSDGYDAIFIADEKEILAKYHTLNSEIIFSSEINCYPYVTFSYLYNEKIKFKYLNSGGYIGRVKDILYALNELEKIDDKCPLGVDKIFSWSNQFHWMKLQLYSKLPIKLDSECSIFQTFVNDLSFKPNPDLNQFEKDKQINNEVNRVWSDFEIVENRLKNIITDNNPCHLHFNGYYMKSSMISERTKLITPWIT